jgi:hypothetical protein
LTLFVPELFISSSLMFNSESSDESEQEKFGNGGIIEAEDNGEIEAEVETRRSSRQRKKPDILDPSPGKKKEEENKVKEGEPTPAKRRRKAVGRKIVLGGANVTVMSRRDASDKQAAIETLETLAASGRHILAPETDSDEVVDSGPFALTPENQLAGSDQSSDEESPGGDFAGVESDEESSSGSSVADADTQDSDSDAGDMGLDETKVNYPQEDRVSAPIFNCPGHAARCQRFEGTSVASVMQHHNSKHPQHDVGLLVANQLGLVLCGCGWLCKNEKGLNRHVGAKHNKVRPANTVVSTGREAAAWNVDEETAAILEPVWDDTVLGDYLPFPWSSLSRADVARLPEPDFVPRALRVALEDAAARVAKVALGVGRSDAETIAPSKAAGRLLLVMPKLVLWPGLGTHWHQIAL